MSTVHCPLYTVHCTLYNIHWTLNTIHFTFYTLHYTLCILNFTMYTVYLTHAHYTIHGALHCKLMKDHYWQSFSIGPCLNDLYTLIGLYTCLMGLKPSLIIGLLISIIGFLCSIIVLNSCFVCLDSCIGLASFSIGYNISLYSCSIDL